MSENARLRYAYSLSSASVGATLAARLEGIQLAASATPTRVSGITVNVKGSAHTFLETRYLSLASLWEVG